MNDFENNNDGILAGAEDFAVTAPVPEIDADELAVAEKEAAESGETYTHTFRKPVFYNGVAIDVLAFDWGKLTGRDALAIENEMQAKGKMVVVPALSGEFLVRVAARASDRPVGTDFFEELPLVEYNKIRSAARSFLLKSE